MCHFFIISATPIPILPPLFTDFSLISIGYQSLKFQIYLSYISFAYMNRYMCIFLYPHLSYIKDICYRYYFMTFPYGLTNNVIKLLDFCSPEGEKCFLHYVLTIIPYQLNRDLHSFYTAI